MRLQPSMYSRMMQSLSSTLSKSKMRPMFSWSSTAYRRASSTNMPEVALVLVVAELLHHDRALEAGLPDEDALVDLAHAARAELLEHLVLGRWHGRVQDGERMADAFIGSQGTRGGHVILDRGGRIACVAAIAGGTWGSTWAIGASAWRSPTRRRPWPPRLDHAGPDGSAQGRRRRSPSWSATTRSVAVVVGLPLNMDGSRGPQAEKVLAFVEGLRGRLDVPGRPARRAPHHGGGGRAAARGGPRVGRSESAWWTRSRPSSSCRSTSTRSRRPRRPSRRGPDRRLAQADRRRSSSWPWPTRAWFHETRWPVRGGGDPPQPLMIAQGAGVLDIGRQLQQLGLVRHPEVFRAYVREPRADGPPAGGRIFARRRDEPRADRGQDRARRRRAPHGHVPGGHEPRGHGPHRRDQGHPGGGFLAAAPQPGARSRTSIPTAKDLEGYLFPDTYDIPRGADPAGQLVARMVRRFREVMAPELPAVAQSGRTPARRS